MFNKKILAAAVAATISQAAFANINLNTGAGSVVVANDSIAYLAAVQANSNGNNTVDFTSGGANSIGAAVVDLGFSVATGANRFVRFDLVNATFDVAAAVGDLTVEGHLNGGVEGKSITVSTGGQIGDSFVVYEISDTDSDLASTVDVAFTLPNLRLNGSTATIQYRLYETGVDAVAGNASVLANSGAIPAISFSAAKTGEFASVETATATVVSSFTAFDAVAASATAFADADTARLGTITPANLLASGRIDLDGTNMTLAKAYDADQTLSLSGTFNFGSWYLAPNDDCTGGPTALTNNLAEDTLTLANYNVTLGAVSYLCVNVDGTETITDQTANISVTLVDDAVTDSAGQTNYDTTSIKIPVLTTFSDYNQRIFITNNSNTPASYRTVFVTESGVTAVAGSAATGSVPANSMVVLRASDMVTITGATRVNATIQIEAEESQIEAVTQTVRIGQGFGQTDTVVLVVDGPDADEI